MALFLTYSFNQEVNQVTTSLDDNILGGNKFNNFTAKSSFEGGYSSVTVLFLPIWGDTP